MVEATKVSWERSEQRRPGAYGVGQRLALQSHIREIGGQPDDRISHRGTLSR